MAYTALSKLNLASVQKSFESCRILLLQQKSKLGRRLDIAALELYLLTSWLNSASKKQTISQINAKSRYICKISLSIVDSTIMQLNAAF